MNPDQINFMAFKYAESTTASLNSICSPLFSLNIKVFAYFRFFHDGRYLYLCNDLNWLQFCLNNVHNNEGTSLGEEIGQVGKDSYHCFLWPTKKIDYLMSALHDFNIWNGLSIFKQREDSIELWGFAADCHAENMQSFYIENIELLKGFTTAFNLHAVDIITPTTDNLAIYKDFKNMEAIIDEYELKKINEFVKATHINKHPIVTNDGEVFLSRKELLCVNNLAAGKSAKQIANIFDSSQRTIEKHIENIKNKLGCHDKATLIKIYKDSILNWL